MTLIPCSFHDGGNRGKREGRRMAKLKTARNSIRVNENALWRKDKPTFYALLYCHDVETRQPSMQNHFVIGKNVHVNFIHEYL